ncbi:MAG: ParB/RepB/Spo0J family partition protein [Rhodobacteraceae bacterium]|nr:ParB/RepB/Spo0J family partition protein [Paracoccaceae bacterium]
MQSNKRLGRGLAALIGDDYSEEGVVEDIKSMRHLPIELLRRNPHNPRKTFGEAELDELAKSIKEKGLLQPIMVRPLHGESSSYEIVAGERRWRASQRAGIHDVPVLIRELTDSEALEFALIENVQRSDLNALEEALGYRQLMDQFSYTQEKMAESLGKSRSHIANTLRLLKLPEGVQEHLRQGKLSAGHARALVAADDPDGLAQKIIDFDLNVREAEKIARPETSKPAPKPASVQAKSANVIGLENDLQAILGLNVEIEAKGESGSLRIDYSSLEQLDDLCARLSKSPNKNRKK